MKKKFALLSIVFVFALVFGTLALATGTSSQENTDKAEKIDKQKCLGCHGPFDKLAEKTADYKAPSGETVTPHRYIPHEGTDIPECTECHTAHPIPLTDKSKVKPANIDYCYNSSCHHMQNLQACSTCH